MINNYTDFTKNDNNIENMSYSTDLTSTEREANFVMPSVTMILQKKRRFLGNKYGEPPAKRSTPSIQLDAGFKWNLQALANAADAVESGGKSPVSALNELGVKVMYKVLRQGGPAHCPSFNVSVTVADMTFEGCGQSKREARASAARACLAALLARAGRVLPTPSQNQDFTSDDGTKLVSDFQCLEAKVNPAAIPPRPDVIATIADVPPVSQQSPSTALFGASVVPSTNKSPINTLYENYPGLTFQCTFGDGSPLETSQVPLQLSHSMRFKVVCNIKEQKYEGYGSSKKLAKLAAARSALAVLDEGVLEPPSADPDSDHLPQTLADHVAKLVNEKFNEVMKNDIIHSKRKVLAGIVITINNKVENAKVIAVTTGTKCVSGEHMSVRGRAVNDCHAEVAARRCLQRHLYAELLRYASQKDPTTPIPDSDLEPVPGGGGYRLRAERQLHLYVSTAPCGDGRIFSPHEQNTRTEPDRHPNRLARGQLRTKIESGEGTIPVKNCNNTLQTWDGVLQGERLLTMSCSDKVARWCVVGMQGALLSRLIKPVYLTSLVLGSLLHQDHMYRAICGRIEKYISCLPPPFRLHRPLLARAASAEARTPARAPSFSVCWCCTTPMPEIINATTGKLESGQPSLLCKQSMFARWQFLVKRLPLLPQNNPEIESIQIPENMENLPYNEAKLMCPTYQVAKNNLTSAFEKAKLGSWIKKPIEQDQFICELIDADVTALFAWAGFGLTEYSTVQTYYNGGEFGDLERKSDGNGLKIDLGDVAHKENGLKVHLGDKNRVKSEDDDRSEAKIGVGSKNRAKNEVVGNESLKIGLSHKNIAENQVNYSDDRKFNDRNESKFDVGSKNLPKDQVIVSESFKRNVCRRNFPGNDRGYQKIEVAHKDIVKDQVNCSKGLKHDVNNDKEVCKINLVHKDLAEDKMNGIRDHNIEVGHEDVESVNNYNRNLNFDVKNDRKGINFGLYHDNLGEDQDIDGRDHKFDVDHKYREKDQINYTKGNKFNIDVAVTSNHTENIVNRQIFDKISINNNTATSSKENNLTEDSTVTLRDKITLLSKLKKINNKILEERNTETLICDEKVIELRTVGSKDIKHIKLNQSFRYIKEKNEDILVSNKTANISKITNTQVSPHKSLINRLKELNIKATKATDHDINDRKLELKSSLLSRKLEIHKKIIGKQ